MSFDFSFDLASALTSYTLASLSNVPGFAQPENIREP